MWSKVQVKWADIISHSEWYDISKAKKLKPCLCYTRGFLFHEDKDKIIVIGSYNLAEDEKSAEPVSDITVLPKGCVLSIKKG